MFTFSKSAEVDLSPAGSGAEEIVIADGFDLSDIVIDFSEVELDVDVAPLDPGLDLYTGGLGGSASAAGTGSASASFYGFASGNGYASVSGSASAYVAPDGSSFATVSGAAEGDVTSGFGTATAGTATDSFSFGTVDTLPDFTPLVLEPVEIVPLEIEPFEIDFSAFFLI